MEFRLKPAVFTAGNSKEEDRHNAVDIHVEQRTMKTGHTKVLNELIREKCRMACRQIARWCNGNTAAFGAAATGSIPERAARGYCDLSMLTESKYGPDVFLVGRPNMPLPDA